MAQKKHNGRSSDLTLSWLTRSHGEDWLQWQQYAAEWMATQDAGVAHRLDALRHFFVTYLMRHAAYAKDVTAFFKGYAEHRASSQEFVEAMQAAGVNNQRTQAEYVSYVAAFFDHVIEQHYSAEDDHGVARPMISNPFERIAKQGSDAGDRQEPAAVPLHSAATTDPLPLRSRQRARGLTRRCCL